MLSNRSAPVPADQRNQFPEGARELFLGAASWTTAQFDPNRRWQQISPQFQMGLSEQIYNLIEEMSVQQPPFMFYDNGMMNFNSLQGCMTQGFKDLFYVSILQENISLREELSRRSNSEKSFSRLGTEPSNQQQPSTTKIQPFSSHAQSYDNSSEAPPIKLKPARAHRSARYSKNETKNIPKNFGKAIISFIQQNKQLTRRIMSKFPQVIFSDFLGYVRSRKRRINSISDLRSLWTDINNPYSKPIRILSNCFLRKYSVEYIFNSRINNFPGHIKYRTRLLEAVQKPDKFTNMKHY